MVSWDRCTTLKAYGKIHIDIVYACDASLVSNWRPSRLLSKIAFRYARLVSETVNTLNIVPGLMITLLAYFL